ncbi:hypothetical protein Trydic_g21429 [Trypoxylus dichotomus]
MKINDFFENTNILITGGTGYIGKVLIEKLLRSQPDINKIYLLIRPNKGKTIENRVKDDIFSKPIFQKVKEANPNFMDKIVLIHGDILEPGLGLSESDKLTLKNEINIVYNSAASLNMKAPLKDNVRGNVVSVLALLDLCRHMVNLKSVVILSTAYSNADRRVIPEEICKSYINPDLILKMCEEMDDKILEKMTPIILNSHPNTYTFSKNLMENMLQRYKDIPIVLFRPAIVMPAYKEPLFGWVDNYNGPVGLFLGCGLGVLRVLYTNNSRGNCVPVDLCTNALICSAVHGTQKRINSDGIAIYNYACERTKQSWRNWIRKANNLELKLQHCIWTQYIVTTANPFIYAILCFLLHRLPALILDPFLALAGSQIRLQKIYNEKIYPFMDVLAYFASNEWIVKEDNVQLMWSDLTQAEQDTYYFDDTRLNFETSALSICSGIKIYLLKEKLEDNYKAIRKDRMFAVAHYTLMTLIFSGIVWICYFLFTWFCTSK